MSRWSRCPPTRRHRSRDESVRNGGCSGCHRATTTSPARGWSQGIRAYAERADVPWFILSAEHGLVRPDDKLAPYDSPRLSKTPREYRRAWGVRVVADLDTAAAGLTGKSIEVHAASAYADAIRPHLIECGAVVVEPLAGLTLGPRLSWYGAEPIARTKPTPGTAELVERLRDSDKAIQPAYFLATGGTGLRAPGLSSWGADADGAIDLSRGLGQPVLPGLIYAGLAGATRASGRKSKNTLWGRIKTMPPRRPPRVLHVPT